jgi:hypothetical protein
LFNFLNQEEMMSEHVYKKIELVGSSKLSIEDAVNNAISTAGETIKNLRWFEIVETRGQIVDNQVAFWQVAIKVGFTVDNG